MTSLVLSNILGAVVQQWKTPELQFIAALLHGHLGQSGPCESQAQGHKRTVLWEALSGQVNTPL